MEGIDLKDRSCECPECGWRLAAGGFCIHYDDGEQGTGEIVAIHDGVPAKISEQQWREVQKAKAILRAERATPVAAQATKRAAPTEGRPGTQLRLADASGRRV